MKRTEFSVSALFVPYLCLLLYLDTYGFFLPFLTAALLHECGHLTVMRLCRVPVQTIRLRPGTAVIGADFPSRRLEFLATAAGPAANLLLAVCFRRTLPVFCLMNLLLLGYNLLPVYPLDGGRLCRLAAAYVFGEQTADTVSRLLSVLTILAVCALGVYATAVRHFGLMPCFFAASLLLRLPNLSCQTGKKLLQYRKDHPKRYHYGSEIRAHPSQGAKAGALRRRRV